MSENVVIKKDRTVTVPASEAKIGVQYDHNVNVITFDCPRYPDDDRSVDMSTMQIYINYMLPDKTLGSYLAENVKVDTNNPDTIHFDWKITRNVTQVKGALQALVCIKKVDADGNELYHWNTDLIQSFRVGEGMECLETISSDYADVISQLLVNMNTVTGEFEALSADVTARTSEETLQGLVNNAASDEKLKSIVDAYMAANPVGINVDDTLTVSGDAADAKITGDRISELKSDIVNIDNLLDIKTQYLKQSDYLSNKRYVWGLPEPIISDEQGYGCYKEPIKLKAGTTYTFSDDVNKSESWLYLNGNGKYHLSDVATGNSYTPDDDYLLYITVPNGSNQTMFVDDDFLPSYYVEGSYNYNNIKYDVRVVDGVLDVNDISDKQDKRVKYFVFPKCKTIKVDSTILVRYNDIIFEGNNTTLVCEYNFPVFSTPTTRINTLTIRNINIKMPSGTNYAIHFHNVIFGKILNCRIDSTNETESTVANTNKNGIIVLDGFCNKISNCILNRCSIVMNCSDNWILDNIIWAYSREFAIDTSKGNNNLIRGNQIIGSALKGGIYTSKSSMLRIIENEFDGNDTDAINSGCALKFYDCENTSIVGNSCYFFSGSGFELYNCRGVTISNNNFVKNNKHGEGKADIYCEYQGATEYDVNMIGNTFYYDRASTDYYAIKEHVINESAIVKSVAVGNICTAFPSYTSNYEFAPDTQSLLNR